MGHYDPVRQISDMTIGDFSGDILLAGTTMLNFPFAAFVICPTDAANDHRVLEPAVIPPKTMIQEFSRELKDDTGGYRYVGGGAVEMGQCLVRSRVPGKTVILSRVGNGDVHRYSEQDAARTIYMGNFDMTTNGAGKPVRNVKFDTNPLIDLALDVECNATFHVRTKFGDYEMSPFISPGSARGIGSYNMADGHLFHYSASEREYELIKKKKSGHERFVKTGKIAQMVLFGMPVNGMTLGDISNEIYEAAGGRARSVAVALYDGGEWIHDVTNRIGVRGHVDAEISMAA